MWHDLRLSIRTLSKHRGFAAIAATVLGLGIGLNVAIFSVVYAMLWKPLPVAAPEELVYFYQVLRAQPNRPTVVSSHYFDDIRRQTGAFAGTTAHWGTSVSLRVDGQTDQVNVEAVLANYFELLGVRMALGRPFVASDDDLSNPQRGIVISHALWTRRFGADPNIIGQEIVLNRWGGADERWTAVGVAAPGFTGLSDPWSPTQAWTTFAQSLDATRLARGIAFAPIARLKPGVSLAQAQDMINAAGHAAWLARTGGRNPQYEPKYIVYHASDVRMPFDPSAAVIPVRLASAMAIVVATVLLVAATNVAGILLARGVGRSGEIAIRRVLGAGTLRIARQLLIETLLLSIAGGLVGLFLGAWLLSLFRALTPVKYAIDVAMNGAVGWFAMAVCLATGTVVGLLPARQAVRVDLLPALAGAGNLMTKHTVARARHAITVPQVACSLVLLLVAAVYVRALLRVELADLGYQPANLVVAQPVLKAEPDRQPNARAQSDERTAERARRFYRQVFERLRTAAGVTDVAIADRLPLSEPVGRPNWNAVAQEAFLAGDRTGPGAEATGVSPGYFRTMNIRLLRGRDFDERDTRQAPNVAILSAAVADRLWPGRDPLEQTFTMINSWSPNDKLEWYRVVGVVNEVSPILHDLGSRPLVYTPLAQHWRPSSGYAIVRGAGDSRTTIPAVKSAIEGADSFADVYRVRTMGQMAAEILYPRRIAGAILALSGAIALLLATVGVYAVVSYAVAQRTGEIGVRMALGAERRDIIALVLREGRTVAALGSAAGLALGYAAIRITSSRYLSLPQIDIATMVATPLVLAVVVLAACYLPARRAARVDPMDVLRRS